ncbi:MAG: PD-(D/E)XK nuclease family protein [Treponema sp.]|nr:PD-(D/E)XK nuclease family protein [Treponema sp.]
MEERKVAFEDLISVFREFLDKENVLFVFSTDVVKNSWIEFLVSNEELSGICAVAEEKFTAWDKFKSQFADDSIKGKTTIPSILRKLFVRSLIKQNETECFFKKIISPQYAKNALSFTDWISSILVSLNFWHEKFINQTEHDEEDEDFLELYNRYKDFLEKNDFYEPSWTHPDFSKLDRIVVLIYPEILEDYCEYENIFRGNSNIVQIHLPDTEEQGPACYKYTDSRKELRRTILLMRKLVNEKKCAWNEIALNVPCLDIYRPYLEREFKKYCVPYVIRAGVSLIVNSAGAIFSGISSCFKNDFSYDSMREVLLNEMIPWKASLKVQKENLLREGCEMRCVCSYIEEQNGRPVNHDVYEEALKATADTNEAELKFYTQFKKDITAICTANSFRGIREAWFIFKQNFIEDKNFSSDADKILSRCVTELNELIEIEETFCEKTKLLVTDHFEFFLNELRHKTYTAQNKTCGLSVYPYKVSAGAAFKFQFVIDASQKNLEVMYKKLPFLNEYKREKLKLTFDDKKYNASKNFIALYQNKNSADAVQFSFAENSFNGFSIAHNYLNELSEEEPLLDLDKDDFITGEAEWFLKDRKAEGFNFTDEQKKQFSEWLKKQSYCDAPADESGAISEGETSPSAPAGAQAGSASAEESAAKEWSPVKENIAEVMQKRLSKITDASTKPDFVITQKDMSDFFPCQRNWILKNVCGLKEDSLDTKLIEQYDEGTVNHEVIERFLKYCNENNNRRLPLTQPDGTFTNEKETFELLKKLVVETIENPKNGFNETPLTKVIFLSYTEIIASTVLDFLHDFCKPHEEKGFGDFSIEAVENWFDSKEKEYYFSGKVDCILNNGEEIFIIDFKTNKTPAKKDCYVSEDGTLSNFQIPMYVSLWNKKHPEQKIENALFYSIKERKPYFVMSSKQIGRDKFQTADEYESTLSAFKNYADEFFNKVQDCDLDPHLNGDDTYNSVDTYAHCSKCSFKSICRTMFSIKGVAIKNDLKSGE